MVEKKDFLVGIIFAAIFFILGLIMIYFGFKIYHKIHSLRRFGVKTRGTIIKYERRRGTKTNDYLVIPIVEFYTISNERIIFEGNIDNGSFLQNICKSGEEVEVIYDAQNPKNAVINTFAEIWFAPLLLWIIGFSFVFFPLYTIWKAYKNY